MIWPQFECRELETYMMQIFTPPPPPQKKKKKKKERKKKDYSEQIPSEYGEIFLSDKSKSEQTGRQLTDRNFKHQECIVISICSRWKIRHESFTRFTILWINIVLDGLDNVWHFLKLFGNETWYCATFFLVYPWLNMLINLYSDIHLYVMLWNSFWQHYSGVIMGALASQITGVFVVCSTVCSCVDQRKHRRSALLAFVRESPGHRWIPLTMGK